MSKLPVSSLVNVSVNLASAPAQAQSLSNLLILGDSNIIDVTQRLRTYSTLTAIANDFGSSAPEYLAAVEWFGQSPQPGNCLIGQWCKTAVAGRLIGALIPAANQLMSAWTGKTTPGFLARIDGIPYAIAPATLATVTNMNGIASIIQTALQLSAASSTCVWDANYNRFVFTSGTTGATSSFNFLAPSAAVGSAEFSGNPANNDLITLNGTTVTFVTGTPTSSQVKIGATLADTLASLLSYLQASTDAQLVKFTYSLNAANTAIYFVAATAGTGGNALTLAKTATAITLSGSTLAGATAQDISGLLGGLSTSSGAYSAPGHDAEAAVDAVIAFDSQFGQQFYGVFACGVADADHLAIAAYIEGANTKHAYGVNTQEAGVLVSTDTANIAYQLKTLGYKKTCVQYSSSNLYAVVSLMARILTTDYTANKTVITLMYKTEPGVVAESLNTNQMTALLANRCNVFVNYDNNTSIIQPGVVASGDFIDTIFGADWLAIDIQNTIYNLLYSNPTKIPQTDDGNNIIATGIEAVCAQGVANGLLAPGTWTQAGFGTLRQGDFVPKGYYIYAPPVALQNPADRAVRKSVTFQVAAKLAGAIHTADVIVNINR